MKRKVITALFTALLLGAVLIQPTYANSAQRHWSGTKRHRHTCKRQGLSACGG